MTETLPDLEAQLEREPSDERITRLSVLIGPEQGKTFSLSEQALIGRQVEADVRLSDEGVSRRHARLTRLSQGSYALEDLRSRNGTLVNGRRIDRVVLRPGDRIQLGSRYLLLFSVHDQFEESFEYAWKMQLVGYLAAGINHDFNNLLCVVLANAAHLLDLRPELRLANPEVRECIEDVRAAAESGAELTARLSTLVRAKGLQEEHISFSQLCEETVSVLRGTVSKSIRLVSHIESGLFVRGVRTHLRQLVLNPCLNALDAMPGGGTLTIEAVLREAHELDSGTPMRAGAYVSFAVTDTGTGMSPSVLRMAFEPFFTTKDIEVGKGLGLPIVRKVASDLGAIVSLTSQEGLGTTLRVVLPAASVERSVVRSDASVTLENAPVDLAHGPSQNVAQPAVAGPLVRCHVLIAESNEVVGRAISRALRRAGYGVTLVVGASAALKEFARHSDAFDLVILDLDLSEVGTAVVYERVRAASAAVPILTLTQHGGPAAGGTRTDSDYDTVVRKPLDPTMLAGLVQQALRRAGRATQP